MRSPKTAAERTSPSATPASAGEAPSAASWPNSAASVTHTSAASRSASVTPSHGRLGRVSDRPWREGGRNVFQASLSRPRATPAQFTAAPRRRPG